MPAKETLETIEKTLDAIESTLDTIDTIPGPVAKVGRWTRRDYVYLAVATQVAWWGGGALSYYLTKKRIEKKLTEKYQAELEKEIEETKEYYNMLHKREEFSTPEKAVETLNVEPPEEVKQAIRNYQGIAPNPENNVEIEKIEVNNIFVDQQPTMRRTNYVIELDWEEEVARREANPDEPYVISEEEYMSNENDYEQTSLTYYAGDGVLTDERDKPIEMIDMIVGEANLERFGHGAEDARIVFVRNNKLNNDFEIALHDGKFSHEVLGFIEHSDDRPKIRKFRGDRD